MVDDMANHVKGSIMVFEKTPVGCATFKAAKDSVTKWSDKGKVEDIKIKIEASIEDFSKEVEPKGQEGTFCETVATNMVALQTLEQNQC